MNRSSKNRIWIYLTIVTAIFMDTFLFPEEVLHIKPLITLLALIYWNMAFPDKIGISEAIVFGLATDLIQGTLLGLHGLLFVLITYVCQRFFYQFRVSPLWQQSLVLFFLFFIFKIILAFDFFNLRDGFNVSDGSYITNALLFSFMSSLFWTPSFLVLREVRRRKIMI